MRKLRPVIGLPVLEVVRGARIGEVRELLLDFGGAVLAGVVVNNANWFNEERGVRFRDIFAIGRDAVTVRDSGAVTDFSALASKAGIHRLSDICGKEIITESGEYLGLVTDVLCDSVTGEIKSYELSDGFITDFIAGRRVMPLPRVQVTGEERLVVPEVMGRLIHDDKNDPGGVV